MTPDEQVRWEEYKKQVEAEQAKKLPAWKRLVNWI
jgi:hypothetical protein